MHQWPPLAVDHGDQNREVYKRRRESVGRVVLQKVRWKYRPRKRHVAVTWRIQDALLQDTSVVLTILTMIWQISILLEIASRISAPPVTAYIAISVFVIEAPDNDSPYTFTTWSIQTNTTQLKSGTKYMAPIIVFLQETYLPAFDPEYASELLQIMEVDFMLTPTGSVTAATASPTSGVTATTPASTSSPGPTNTPTTSGLSTGAKADIGIGAVCIASFLLYKKMFQRKAKLDRDSSLQNQQPELVQARIPEATA
jgi:hypothetical protein